MKHTFFLYLAALTTTIFSGCSNETVTSNSTLERVDSLINENPDSALLVLSQLELKVNDMEEDDRMFFRLLKIKAADKAYIDNISIKDVTELVDYYQQKEDSCLFAMALYYSGSAYRNLNNAPLAIKFFSQALEKYEEIGDTERAAAIHFQIGFLLLKQKLPDQAMAHFNQSYDCYKKLKDTTNLVYIIEKMALVYEVKNDKDSCMALHRQAYDLAEQAHNNILKGDVRLQSASMLLKNKDYKEAEQILNENICKTTYTDSCIHEHMLLCLYLGTKRYDKAESSALKLTLNKRIIYRASAYLALTQIYLERNEAAKAYSYLKQYLAYNDSIKNDNEKAEIQRCMHLYNYNRLTEENIKNEMKAANYKHNMLWLLFISVVIILVFINLYLKNRKERRAIRIRLKEYEQIYSSKQAESSNALYYQNISFLDDTLNGFIDNCIKNGNVIKDNEWDILEATIRVEAPYFKPAIYSIMPMMSKQYYHLCMLIKIGGIKGKDMATLMGRTPSTISKMKTNIKNKVLGKNADIDLDYYFTDILK